MTKPQKIEGGKKVTINEKLIAAVAYKNPNNDLIQNIGTMGAIWRVLRDRKEEVIKILSTK